MVGSPNNPSLLPLHNPPPHFPPNTPDARDDIAPEEDEVSSIGVFPKISTFRSFIMRPRPAIVPIAVVGLLLMIPAGIFGGVVERYHYYYDVNHTLPLVGIAPISCSMIVQIATVMARQKGKKVPLWLTLILDTLIFLGMLAVLILSFLIMPRGVWEIYATVPMLLLCFIHLLAAGQDATRAFRDWVRRQGGGFFRVGEPAVVGDIRVVCTECGRHGRARDAEFSGQEDAVQVGVEAVETGIVGVVV